MHPVFIKSAQNPTPPVPAAPAPAVPAPAAPNPYLSDLWQGTLLSSLIWPGIKTVGRMSAGVPTTPASLGIEALSGALAGAGTAGIVNLPYLWGGENNWLYPVFHGNPWVSAASRSLLYVALAPIMNKLLSDLILKPSNKEERRK